MRDFLRAEIQALAQDTKIQTWTADVSNGKVLELTNIIGRFFASEQHRVVLAAAYDDSGSGPAVLIELARNLINSPAFPRVGVDVVLLDGGAGEGATYFGDHLPDVYGSVPPISLVVLNGICDRDIQILKEPTLLAAAMVNAPADVPDGCSARRLEIVAQKTLDYLNGIR